MSSTHTRTYVQQCAISFSSPSLSFSLAHVRLLAACLHIEWLYRLLNVAWSFEAHTFNPLSHTHTYVHTHTRTGEHVCVRVCAPLLPNELGALKVYCFILMCNLIDVHVNVHVPLPPLHFSSFLCPTVCLSLLLLSLSVPSVLSHVWHWRF